MPAAIEALKEVAAPVTAAVFVIVPPWVPASTVAVRVKVALADLVDNHLVSAEDVPAAVRGRAM